MQVRGGWRRAANALGVAAASSLVIGCGSNSSGDRIDEQQGEYHGVGIGATRDEVEAALGEPGEAKAAYPIEPLGAGSSGAGGPFSVVTGPYRLGSGEPPDREQRTLRYEEVSFFTYKDRVFGWMAIAADASTKAGPAVGDSLSEVKAAFPALRCAPAVEGDTAATQAESCSGRLAGGHYIYFGGDPVESITVIDPGFPTPSQLLSVTRR